MECKGDAKAPFIILGAEFAAMREEPRWRHYACTWS